MFSEWAALAAVAATVSALIVVGGLIFRLSGRLTRADTKADAAEKLALALRHEVDQVERELVEHRVYVAREYVSNSTIAGLEMKLIEAINRLGDRLDSLFTRAP